MYLRRTGWTNKEIRVLREMYATAPMSRILAALPRHTLKSIRARAASVGVRRVLEHPPRNWAAIVAAHKFTFDLGVRTP